MNVSMCSTSFDMAFSSCESLRGRNLYLLPSKSFCNNIVRMHNPYPKKVVVSRHLEPNHLEGSFPAKEQLQGINGKLQYLRTLLIDNYDSYTHNIFQEPSIVNGFPPVVVQNDEWTWNDVYHYLYEEKAFDNIVISPGPGSPTCSTDIGICVRLLLECGDIPIFGVCLGHQGMCMELKVVHAPEPVHGRLSDIDHNFCGLFHDIPSGRNSGFKVVRYHSLVIDPQSLPRESISIAWTSSPDAVPFLGFEGFDSISDSHDRQASQQGFLDCMPSSVSPKKSWPYCHSEEIKGDTVLMGIMHSSRPHYGLQFHPERVATCHGRKIFRNFADNTKDYWFRLWSSSGQQRLYADNFLAIDHHKDDLYIMSIHEKSRQGTTLLHHLVQNLLGLESRATKNVASQTSQGSIEDRRKLGLSAQKSRQQYIEDVYKCQKFIREGESYELVLTIQLKKKLGDIDPLGLYLNLREKNPAPYAAWLNFSKQNLCICCSSPERFLPLDKDGILEAKSIKGTIARGSTKQEDELLKLQLQYSEKDHAENLMIADLLRNDLGRVCEPGSVHVPHLMEIESNATVHCMVSTVRGKKRANVSAMDCFRAAFPGGCSRGEIHGIS